jgi:hypothetical protein
MKQQPDNLFRDKLANLRLEAPENAWSRIETGLDKPSRKGLWMKIAAGLLLLAVAGVLIWNVTSLEGTNTLASHVPDEKTGADESSTGSMNEKPEQTPLALNEEPKKAFSKSVKEKKNEPLLVDNNTLASVPAIQTKEVTSPAEMKVTEISTPELNQTPSENQTAVYLVYTAEEVNQKYLRKPPEDDATQEDKKSSRMQMLMGVAMNLKNGDGGLGDLRQIKDEILALNFLDEKKQSKKN